GPGAAGAARGAGPDGTGREGREEVGPGVRQGAADPTSVPEQPTGPSVRRHPVRRLPLLLRADAVWPHHLVVLVLEHVAVPDELAGVVEGHPALEDAEGPAGGSMHPARGPDAAVRESSSADYSR